MHVLRNYFDWSSLFHQIECLSSLFILSHRTFFVLFIHSHLENMSVGIIERQVLYDNPSAPIVKFSSSEDFDEDDDMTNDQPFIQSTLGLLCREKECFLCFLLDRTFI